MVIQHIYENDSERPNVGMTGSIRRGAVVATFVAHVGSTSAVHIRRLFIGSRETKVGELNDDFTFTLAIDVNKAISDDKVL
jgi:hypothetical protein